MLSVFYVPSLSGTLQLAAAGLCSTWYNGYLVAAVLGWVLVSDAVIITMHFADRAWVRAPSRMCCNLLHPLFFSLECHCTNVRYIYIYICDIYVYIFFFIQCMCFLQSAFIPCVAVRSLDRASVLRLVAWGSYGIFPT